MQSEGASPNERLLASARSDNQEELLEAIDDGADINCTDGAGNTPLHLAVRNKCTEVLEDILSHDECDVDPVNLITGETPLHYAIQVEEDDLRRHIVDSLLDAGADISIRDKTGFTVLDIIPKDDTVIRPLLQKAEAVKAISAEDVADDDDDDDESEGSNEE